MHVGALEVEEAPRLEIEGRPDMGAGIDVNENGPVPAQGHDAGARPIDVGGEGGRAAVRDVVEAA